VQFKKKTAVKLIKIHVTQSRQMYPMHHVFHQLQSAKHYYWQSTRHHDHKP